MDIIEKLQEIRDSVESEIYQAYREAWHDSMNTDNFSGREAAEIKFEEDWKGSVTKGQLNCILEEIDEVIRGEGK